MSEETHVRFPLLAEESYDPNTFDYCQTNKNNMPTAKDWIEVFRSSIPGFKKMAAKDETVDADTRAAKAKEFADRYGRRSGDASFCGSPRISMMPTTQQYSQTLQTLCKRHDRTATVPGTCVAQLPRLLFRIHNN